MTHSVPRDDPADPRWRVVDALRRYGQDSARLAHAFSSRHDLQTSDLQALIAVMEADQRGEPLTPGALRAHLRLSSAGTSYVIDRLERAGHVRRTRDHPTDSRVVHLRHTGSGRETAGEFFGPLVGRTDAVMGEFSDDELAMVARFLDGAARSVRSYLDDLEA